MFKMFITIIRLCKGQYLKYSLLLGISLFFTAILNGLGVAILAPLLEFDSASQSDNLFVSFFHASFQYFGIPFSLLNILLLALIIVTLAGFLSVISVFYQKRIQLEQEIEKKGDLYKLLSHVKLDKLQSMNYGNVIQVIQQETRSSSQLIDYFVRLVSSFLNVVVYIGVLFLISMKMTIYVSLALCLFFYVFRNFFHRAKSLGKDIGSINDNLQQIINTMLYGYKTIKSYLTYNVMIDKQFSFLKEYKKKNYEMAIIESALSSVFQPMALLIVVSSFLVYRYSVAELLVFVAAIVRLYEAVKVAQNASFKLSFHYASLERIGKLEDELRSSQYDYMTDGLSSYCFDKDIRVVDLSFRYQSDMPVLDKINLSIPKGSKIALVGKSGGGKSTFVDLLMRFYSPQEGSLELDGIPFEKLPYEDYIGKIGYVTQDPFMLNASILDNVTLYREISEEQVVSSLKKAHAFEFVSNLHEGINTIMGESGTMLSGGQRQRIALARALAGTPDILILDEATSALDNESERIVQEAIEELGKDITVIIIAHRLSTIRKVDTIYVFQQGRVVEQGTYAQLEEKNGVFSELLKFAS